MLFKEEEKESVRSLVDSVRKRLTHVEQPGPTIHMIKKQKSLPDSDYGFNINNLFFRYFEPTLFFLEYTYTIFWVTYECFVFKNT